MPKDFSANTHKRAKKKIMQKASPIDTKISKKKKNSDLPQRAKRSTKKKIISTSCFPSFNSYSKSEKSSSKTTSSNTPQEDAEDSISGGIVSFFGKAEREE
jgi:hypothetical protein